ncbi:MAG: DNA polymerase subunit beta [Planctomycetes bacterium RBG_13_63_9]|nr:MAG: DNA polymerase subunit beta [Planctomycetes bacterium RBG_13_63_9]
MRPSGKLMTVDEATIAKAVDMLRQAADPDKIILFGSYARDQADPGSDLDLLVVESEVSDAAAEMVRLMRVLSPLRIPADVLVVSRQDYARWRDTPGHVFFEAAKEGRVLYEAA